MSPSVGRPSLISKLAQQAGQSVPEYITALVEKHRTVDRAAIAISISPSTLRLHIRLHGLKSVRCEMIVAKEMAS